MNKNDCKIVRDLFPNYVEGLINNETKEFVEKHIAECKECKEILTTLQEEKAQKTEQIEKEDDFEINYLKKYNRKLKILEGIVISIIILILILWGGVLIKGQEPYKIVREAYDKLEELRNEDNIMLSKETIRKSYYDEDNKYNTQVEYNTFYYKNQTLKREEAVYNPKRNDLSKYISYEKIEGEQILHITAMDSLNYKGKLSQYYDYSNLKDLIIPHIKEAVFNGVGKRINEIKNVNRLASAALHLRTEQYNQRECYVVKAGTYNNYVEVWIDKENMLILKEIEDRMIIGRTEINYTWGIGAVTDEDIKIPDLSDYEDATQQGNPS